LVIDVRLAAWNTKSERQAMLLSVRSHFVALLVDRPLIGLALRRTLLR